MTSDHGNEEDTYSGPHAFTWKPLTGYDCTRAECPKGDDILTPGQTEIQQINCTTNDGSFKLVFRNKATDAIPWDAPAQRVKQEAQDEEEEVQDEEVEEEEEAEAEEEE